MWRSSKLTVGEVFEYNANQSLTHISEDAMCQELRELFVKIGIIQDSDPKDFLLGLVNKRMHNLTFTGMHHIAIMLCLCQYKTVDLLVLDMPEKYEGGYPHLLIEPLVEFAKNTGTRMVISMSGTYDRTGAVAYEKRQVLAN